MLNATACLNDVSTREQDLRVDWRLGAEVFESLLRDHDWAVNSSNWAYFAGDVRLQPLSMPQTIAFAVSSPGV